MWKFWGKCESLKKYFVRKVLNVNVKYKSDMLWDVKMVCVILVYHEIWMPLNVIVVDLWDDEVCCEHRVLIL